MAVHWYVAIATGTVIDITDRVRLPHEDEEKPGASVGANAEEGSGQSVTIEVDDPNGDLVLIAHRRVYAVADQAPVGHQRVGNWWISDLDVVWAEPFDAVSRTWIVTMEDENSIIPRRIFVGTDSARPAETDVERITWLLTTTELNTVKDSLYFDTTGPKNLDKADLTGQTADTMLSSARDASGKNYFIWFNELAIAGTSIVSSSVANPTVITTSTAHDLDTGAMVTIAGHSGSTPALNGAHVVTVLSPTTFSVPVNVTVGGTGGTVIEPRYSLAYFNFNTYTLYESAIKLSNVDSEIDGTTVFALSQDVKLSRAGGRIASGNYKPYDGGYVYVEDPTVYARYVPRDVSTPAINTKVEATALSEATRQLHEMSEPDDVVTTTLTVQEANVNAVMHGMRIPMHATHLPDFGDGSGRPGYAADYVWMRVMKRTVTQLAHTTLELPLTLTPQLFPTCSTQVAVISVSDSGTQGRDYPPVSTAIPAIAARPSVLFGLWVGNSYWDDGGKSFIQSGGAWTHLDGYQALADTGATATTTVISYYPIASGSPAALGMTWSRITPGFTDLNWRALGFSINTSATAPVQTGRQLLTGGTITLPAAPTPGNLLVLVRIAETTAGGEEPPLAGWTEIKSVNFEETTPSHVQMTLFVRCVSVGDSAAWTVQGGSFSHWAFMSEWAIS